MYNFTRFVMATQSRQGRIFPDCHMGPGWPLSCVWESWDGRATGLLFPRDCSLQEGSPPAGASWAFSSVAVCRWVSAEAAAELQLGNHTAHFCLIPLVKAHQKANLDFSSWKLGSASCQEPVALFNLSQKTMVEDTGVGAGKVKLI